MISPATAIIIFGCSMRPLGDLEMVFERIFVGAEERGGASEILL
jgi:hypothetical protein